MGYNPGHEKPGRRLGIRRRPPGGRGNGRSAGPDEFPDGLRGRPSPFSFGKGGGVCLGRKRLPGRSGPQRDSRRLFLDPDVRPDPRRGIRRPLRRDVARRPDRSLRRRHCRTHGRSPCFGHAGRFPGAVFRGRPAVSLGRGRPGRFPGRSRLFDHPLWFRHRGAGPRLQGPVRSRGSRGRGPPPPAGEGEDMGLSSRLPVRLDLRWIEDDFRPLRLGRVFLVFDLSG